MSPPEPGKPVAKEANRRDGRREEEELKIAKGRNRVIEGNGTRSEVLERRGRAKE